MSMFFMESVMYQKHLADVIVFFTKDDQLIHAKWCPWCQTKMRWGYCYIVDMCVSLLSLFTVLLQTDYRYHVCYWAIVTTVITSLYQVARCGQWGWWPWPGVLLVTGWSRTWSLLPTASLSYLLSISVPAISQQFVSSDDNTTQNIFKNINGSVNSYLVKCAVKLVR